MNGQNHKETEWGWDAGGVEGSWKGSKLSGGGVAESGGDFG